MKKLEVFFCGWGQHWLLGTLADNGTELLFEYSPQALAQGIELSPRMLKLRAGAYGGFPVHQHRLPGLIADALPDGWGMLLMERLFVQQGLERSRISPLDKLLCLISKNRAGSKSDPDFFDKLQDGIVPHRGDFEEILRPFGFVN